MANYAYENNVGFEEINTWVDDGEGYDIDFTFSSEDTYEVLYSIGLYENMSAVTLKRDAQGRIIEYQRIDLDTQETKILQFEYANGNMVTINEVSEDILWTIEYDDKKSFYVPGIYQQTNLVFGRDFDYFLGFPELRVYFWKEIKKIPEFIAYKNQNNPLQIYKNGNLSWTFDYEYNSLGYPVKVFQGTMDPFILEYIRFEL